MCGIAGFWAPSRPRYEPEIALARMTRQIEHRGPDSCGQYLDHGSGIALGHRRLSIVDLSPEGSQPMVSQSKRYVLAFNGEIFNYRDIRAELSSSNVTFRGQSDTEVLLAAVERWGLRHAIDRCVGMFALALWDTHAGSLQLARDRLGVKPLYYGQFDGTLLFGSELKALQAHPVFTASINIDAIAEYVKFSYVPAPTCVYEGVTKLPPGTILSLNSPNGRVAEPTKYWSASNVARAQQDDRRFLGTTTEAVDQLEHLLADAVRIRMVADVPVGAFLSGGIDSSLVVALMQASSAQRVKTYSIGVAGTQLDESAHARAVAEHIGTDHTALNVSEQHAAELIPHLPAIYDEPFADSSQIPTYLVSALARTEVSVALSGDGGDEVFGGYNRHIVAPALYAASSRLPLVARKALAQLVRSFSEKGLDRAANVLQWWMPPARRQLFVGAKIHKVSRGLAAESAAQFYDELRSIWGDPSTIVAGYAGTTQVKGNLAGSDFASQMMYHDLISYLPDDILTKVDRSTMAVALEARVPLLDHRVVEFAWSLPADLKIRNGVGKWILREVLSRYVPRQMFERPKTGFGIPIGSWLKGPLRSWAEDLLSETALKREGLLNPRPIRSVWKDHLQGRGSHEHQLWNVLMLQAWSVQQKSASSAPTIFERGPLLLTRNATL